MEWTKKSLNHLVYQVIGAAIEVHKQLGPGLLEKIYHKCMEKELEIRGIPFESELKIPLNYKGTDLNTELKCDFLIDKILVVELKAVEYVIPLYEAQVLTYMKLLKVPKGIIINFNSDTIFYEGQSTFVNEYYRELIEK